MEEGPLLVCECKGRDILRTIVYEKSNESIHFGNKGAKKRIFVRNFASMNNKKCQLKEVTASSFSNEPQILGYGELLLCDRGWARVRIEFSQWTIHAGETITFFPTDIVQIEDVSEDFHGIALVYSDDMLRMASLHIEESVYFSLRNDRLCRERQIVADVISPMLTILQHFFSTDGCRVTDEIVALQLKSFFLGFSDFLRQHPELRHPDVDSQRTDELFARFMNILEHDFMESKDVQYYADRLCITRKYLAVIVKRKTGKTPKMMINEYVITRLKLRLRNTNDSIRQIATTFHFPDDSLMIRYFKAHTGMTPVQYRRNTQIR